MEHELNIDKSSDIRVPLRKIGRVAAFRKGLKYTGYNIVRTVADMQNLSQLLDWDRHAEEGAQEGKQVEQVRLWPLTRYILQLAVLAHESTPCGERFVDRCCTLTA